MTFEEAIQILLTNNGGVPLSQQQVVDMNYALGNVTTVDQYGNVTSSQPGTYDPNQQRYTNPGNKFMTYQNPGPNPTAAPYGTQQQTTRQQTLSDTDGSTDPKDRPYGFRLQMPDGSIKKFAVENQELVDALQAGAKPIWLDGTLGDAQYVPSTGGWLISFNNPSSPGNVWIPLNVLGGGDWTPGQQEWLDQHRSELRAPAGTGARAQVNGKDIEPLGPDGKPLPPDTGNGEEPPLPPAGGAIVPGAGSKQIGVAEGIQYPSILGTNFSGNEDWKTYLSNLLNRSTGIGNVGAEQLNNLRTDQKNWQATTWSGATDNLDFQRKLVQQLMGTALPGVTGAINNANQQLSPLGQDIFSGVAPTLNQLMGVRDQGLSPLSQSILGGIGPHVGELMAGQNQDLAPLSREILGGVGPHLGEILANTNQGLSPGAMAALKTQALEQVPANFNRAEQDIRSQLARRGAIGGDMPGSAGDIVREFGGLEAQKEALRSGLMSQAQLANEQARQQNNQLSLGASGQASDIMQLVQQALQSNKQAGLGAAGIGSNILQQVEQTLNQNRQLGLGATGMAQNTMQLVEDVLARNRGLGLSGAGVAQGLMGTAGNIYDPSPWIGATGAANQGMLNTVNAQTGSQLGGLSIAQQLGESLAGHKPEDLSKILLGGGLGAFGPLFAEIFKKLTGGSGADPKTTLTSGGTGGFRPPSIRITKGPFDVQWPGTPGYTGGYLGQNDYGAPPKGAGFPTVRHTAPDYTAGYYR